MEVLERLAIEAQNFTAAQVNVTALLGETQALLEPLCAAAGVPEDSCTLRHAAVATICGAGIVWAVAGHALLGAQTGSSKRKASSESDDEGSGSGKPAWRPSRPPERYVDSSEEDEAEEEQEEQEGEEEREEEGENESADSGKNDRATEEGGERETEEGLLERRQLMVESRPARMAEAIDELESLHDSDDILAICDVMRKHAGKPADCRPAWLKLQARLRVLVAAQPEAEAEAESGEAEGGEAASTESAALAKATAEEPSSSSTVTVEQNPAHDPDTDGSS